MKGNKLINIESNNYFTSSNQINIIRRTIENNTHEVIEDFKLKRITSWRLSENKFKKSLIFNILTFGILHLISLIYPKLYLKLYCNPWPAKESDYFLVENIYGNLTLCKIIHKKSYNKIDKIKNELNELRFISKYNNFINNITYSFEYKSILYEYNENENVISPIYMNLSKMKNKDIFEIFSDGLSSKKIVNLFQERYGKNEYNLNIKILFIFFIKNQIPSLIIVIIIGILEYISTFNIILMQIKLYCAIIIIIIQLIIIKINFINKFDKEYTLDGKKNKVKVKRKYLLKDNNQVYYNLENIDLLPGDIIFLNNNDYVPCDCIVLDGECLVSESNLTGNLNIYKKYALKNNSILFNYKNSNIHILYHGMKIIKSISKTNNKCITALCINIGSNTFKANEYSNTLYFLERKKEYNNVYNIFGERKKIFLYIILCILIVIFFGIAYFFLFLEKNDLNMDFLKKNLSTIIKAFICKSLMSIFFIIQNIIFFFASFQLNKYNILCFDNSRLIKSGKINTILVNKTETLCKTGLEIYSYHPVLLSTQRPFGLIFKNYLKNNCKELNKLLFEYYKNYKNNIQKNYNNKHQFKEIIIKYEESMISFIECLFCCNNIEKYGMNFFGNNIEEEIFQDMKWDIKQDDENNDKKIKIKYFKKNNINHFYYIINKISDIFPKNYYKLTQSSNNNKTKSIEKKELINFNNTKNNIILRSDSSNTISSSSINIITKKQINLDISNSVNSYKLRIYKKFITNDSFNSAAIVYNFLTKELRFMIKGYPEEIINKCNKDSLPENFEKIISINRKNGFIILVCAVKKIEIDEYNDTNELEDYLYDLTFCGFITLKNNIQDYVKSSIQELKKYNINFLIISGDNEYNCLSTGFNSDIIDNKNIFILDKEENNKITIKKIYSFKYPNVIKEEKTNNSKISKYIDYFRVNTKDKKKNFEHDENNNILTVYVLIVKPKLDVKRGYIKYMINF
jgi:cation-transporting ATPase 13A3/4/5